MLSFSPLRLPFVEIGPYSEDFTAETAVARSRVLAFVTIGVPIA